MTDKLKPFLETINAVLQSPQALEALARLPVHKQDFLNEMSSDRLMFELQLIADKAPQPATAKAPPTQKLSLGARRFLGELLSMNAVGTAFFVKQQNVSNWSEASLYKFWKELDDTGCVVPLADSRRGRYAQKKLTPRALIYSVMQPAEVMKRKALSPTFWNNVELWSAFFQRWYQSSFGTSSRFVPICRSAALAWVTLGAPFANTQMTDKQSQQAIALINATARFFGVYQNNNAEWVESENPYGNFNQDNTGVVFADRLLAASDALWLELLETPVEQQRKLVPLEHVARVETEAERSPNTRSLLFDTEGPEPALPDFNEL